MYDYFPGSGCTSLSKEPDEALGGFMHRSFSQPSAAYRAIILIAILAIAGQPLLSQGQSDDHRVFPERPPAGYARPPIHLKGTNASRGPSGMSPASTRHAYGFDQ